MGLVLSRESASDDMEGLLYSFRKAKKGKQARKDFKVCGHTLCLQQMCCLPL